MTAVPRIFAADPAVPSSGAVPTSGVAFLHELTAAEQAAGVLSADGVLALWMHDGAWPVEYHYEQSIAASGGSGILRPVSSRELPFALPLDGSPGKGLFGQALVGPAGWLTGFQPGDVLEIRFDDGRLTVSPASGRVCGSDAVERLMGAFGDAIKDAVDGFACGEPDDGRVPAADLAPVLSSLIRSEPELFADPIPPLGPWLERLNLETYAGRIGLIGTPWNPAVVSGLDRAAATVGMMALHALLAWDSADTDHLSGLLAEIVATPGLVRYLADEIECRVASDGHDLRPAMDWLGTTATTPAERAAAALFSARAAEGAGDCLAANTLVQQALADDPALVPALLDAGEYAVGQGDLEVAAGVLARADHPDGADLLAAIETRRKAPVPAGKNRPCPCGSGRKTKLCCGTGALAPLSQRAALLYSMLSNYARRPAFRNRLGALRAAVGDNPLVPMAFLLDLVVAQPDTSERFLRTRGQWLRPDERELIEQWATVPLGWYEVRQARGPESVTLAALPDHTPVVLREKAFTVGLGQFDLLVARLLSDGSRPRGFAGPVIVSRERRQEFVALQGCAPGLRQLAAFLGPQPEPYLCNSDGHDYVDAEVTLKVPQGQPGDPADAGELAEVAWRKLAKDLVPTRRDVLEYQVERDGMTLSLGTVTRKGWVWTLWANSEQRLAELERRVREVVPTATEVARKAQRIGGEPPDPTQSPLPGRWVRRLTLDSHLIVPGEAAESCGDTDPVRAAPVRARSAAAAWLDLPLPELGVTPRKASGSSDAAVRAELAAILDDLEWRDAREAAAGRQLAMDVAWLRQQLETEPADGTP